MTYKRIQTPPPEELQAGSDMWARWQQESREARNMPGTATKALPLRFDNENPLPSGDEVLTDQYQRRLRESACVDAVHARANLGKDPKSVEEEMQRRIAAASVLTNDDQRRDQELITKGRTEGGIQTQAMDLDEFEPPAPRIIRSVERQAMATAYVPPVPASLSGIQPSIVRAETPRHQPIQAPQPPQNSLTVRERAILAKQRAMARESLANATPVQLMQQPVRQQPVQPQPPARTKPVRKWLDKLKVLLGV